LCLPYRCNEGKQDNDCSFHFILLVFLFSYYLIFSFSSDFGFLFKRHVTWKRA
jgi:hypothetical protein